MTRKSIREIISVYLRNDVPEQVKDSFETWIMDSDGYEEKEEALEELWESFETPAETPDLPSAAYVIRSAENFRKGRALRVSKRKNIFLWISSVAAAVLAIVSVTLFISGREVVTCLASSDSAIGAFMLPDGSQVWLNRGSRLYYSGELDGRKRMVRLEGEGYFDVAEDTEHPFVVEAHDLDVTVLGTEFTITAYDESKVTAYLQEGCIKATGPDLKDGIILTPNHSVTYDKASGTYSKKAVQASNHTSWIGERIVFNNTSLYDIMENLCHWYNVEITCNDEEFARETKLSFTVRKEPLHEILSAIEALAPVVYSSVDSHNITLIKTTN